MGFLPKNNDLKIFSTGLCTEFFIEFIANHRARE